MFLPWDAIHVYFPFQLDELGVNEFRAASPGSNKLPISKCNRGLMGDEEMNSSKFHVRVPFLLPGDLGFGMDSAHF